MFISDLNYLETATEATAIQGAYRKNGNGKKPKYGYSIEIEDSFNKVVQVANVNQFALAIGGGKYSETEAENKAYISQYSNI
ncbi:MAG: hypothetical protein HC890_11730 [Chloroflexaceae bacterium]|nr:hypothetical protein [Chloroflexaceae bacterium]